MPRTKRVSKSAKISSPAARANGSVPAAIIAKEIPRVLDLAAQGQLQIDTEPAPLSDVAAVWNEKQDGCRIVLIP